MPALLEADASASAALRLRTITVGLLGLGRVGQAVARLAADTARLKQAGLRVRIAGALVRDIDAPRRCLKPGRITTNPSAFLRGHYDVVVEALGSVEPAGSIVRRLLGRGVPVVTANKALVAMHGRELAALASRRGTTFRYEASALAGVPFLGAFAARPLVSDVRQFTGVVNGTSNFVLSELGEGRASVDEAVERARSLGLSEPDPARDLDGQDAADKLSLLASIFGWGTLPSFRVDTQGIRELTPHDLKVARALSGTIKPVVYAARGGAGVTTFVGPAFIAQTHPLASLHGALSGIHLRGAFVSDLFFSGPGAGPDITAATVLDDVVEAVSTQPTTRGAPAPVVSRAAIMASPPATEWLIRVRFPGVVPEAATVERLLNAYHVPTLYTTDAIEQQRWVRTAQMSAAPLSHALSHLRATHRVHTLAIRAL